MGKVIRGKLLGEFETKMLQYEIKMVRYENGTVNEHCREGVLV